MIFEIDPVSSTPIYEQIVQNFKRAVFAGILKPDEKLPSVREIAIKLSVNPNTVSRAYMELERENMVYTQRGRGTFVKSLDESFRKNETHKILHGCIDTLFNTATKLNVDHKELEKMINQELKKYKNRKRAEEKL